MRAGLSLAPRPSFAPSRRFACALACSAALHLFLAGLLSLDARGGAVSLRAPAPIVVRLEAPAAREPAETAPRAPPSPAREHDIPAGTRVKTAVPSPGEAEKQAQTPMPQPPRDPVYYSARELDDYPRPLAPTGFEALVQLVPERTAPRARVMLRIDEYGSVTGVELIEPQPPSRFGEAVRAALLAVRFVPARRDGRAVKSRIELDLDLGASAAVAAAGRSGVPAQER
jgi:protein TonB